jgi:hypothetical protein
MFEQEVATKDGQVRMIRARTLDALNEAVQAAQNDVQAVSPDISGDPAEPVVEAEAPKPKKPRAKKVQVVEAEAQREADDSMEKATEVAEALAETAKAE